jgi:hypothetical protein
MVSKKFFEKMQMYLFDDPKDLEKVQFTEKELELKKRYMTVFTYWFDKPTFSEKKIIDFMIRDLGVARTQAYRDLHKIKILLGNVRNASKEWHRYKVIAMLDRAYELAESRNDATAMISAADKLAKYTQLDKEEGEKIPYDQIVPQTFEPTTDVSVLGLEPITNLKERQEKLRLKYGGQPVEEAVIIEQTDGNDGKEKDLLQ